MLRRWLRHLSFTCVGGKTSPELHRETFERLDLFLEQNLRVFYVWEHEFTEWRKLAARAGSRLSELGQAMGVSAQVKDPFFADIVVKCVFLYI